MAKALINHRMLTWARESARISVEDVARKFNKEPHVIQAWESGSDYPTLVQLRTLSDTYKRSIAIFYLPSPPEDFQPIKDFRKLPREYSREFSTELLFLLRDTQDRKRKLKEILIADGVEELDFVGSVNRRTNSKDVSEAIRKTLGLTIEDPIKCRKPEEFFKLLSSKAEEQGIFVFRKGGIDSEEARGFVLCDKYAPFIFINSGDSISAQIFTLAHELVHLWINQEGISNLAPLTSVSSEEELVEVFCNKVANELLVEDRYFDKFLVELNAFSIDERINRISDVFKVSREVIARKILDKGLITKKKYEELKEQYKNEWNEFKRNKKEKFKAQEGGPSYYLLTTIANGYSYTRRILGAYYSGILSGRDSSGLLGVKLNNFAKLAVSANYGRA